MSDVLAYGQHGFRRRLRSADRTADIYVGHGQGHMQLHDYTLDISS
jgi:hypothetical protein